MPWSFDNQTMAYMVTLRLSSWPHHPWVPVCPTDLRFDANDFLFFFPLSSSISISDPSISQSNP